MALEGAVALAQPLGQDLDAGADIDHQIGPGELSVEQAVDALVEHQFVGIEIEAGEDPMFIARRIVQWFDSHM